MRRRYRGHGGCHENRSSGQSKFRFIRRYCVEYRDQYFYETKQPQRRNFIARQLSFHGNSLGSLSLASHVARRAPYEAILNHESFHHVSPAYAKRFQRADETEEQYVERLRKELEDKFEELGPDTVIGCEY